MACLGLAIGRARFELAVGYTCIGKAHFGLALDCTALGGPASDY